MYEVVVCDVQVGQDVGFVVVLYGVVQYEQYGGVGDQEQVQNDGCEGGQCGQVEYGGFGRFVQWWGIGVLYLVWCVGVGVFLNGVVVVVFFWYKYDRMCWCLVFFYDLLFYV